MKITSAAHVGLLVDDIEKTKAFYTEKLGFEVILIRNKPYHEGFLKLAWLKRNETVIACHEFHGVKEYEKEIGLGRFEHICLNTDDIEKTIAEFKRNGIEFETETFGVSDEFFGGSGRHIMFRGPSGEHLEVMQLIPGE